MEEKKEEKEEKKQMEEKKEEKEEKEEKKEEKEEKKEEKETETNILESLNKLIALNKKKRDSDDEVIGMFKEYYQDVLKELLHIGEMFPELISSKNIFRGEEDLQFRKIHEFIKQDSQHIRHVQEISTLQQLHRQSFSDSELFCMICEAWNLEEDAYLYNVIDELSKFNTLRKLKMDLGENDFSTANQHIIRAKEYLDRKVKKITKL